MNDESVAGPSHEEHEKKAMASKIMDELKRLLYESDDEEWSHSDFDEMNESPSEEDIKDPSLASKISWQTTLTDMENLKFTRRNELLVPLPENNSPFGYFQLLLDDAFLNVIVEETNNYAQELLQSEGIKEKSRISRWKEVTVPELRIFFGVILHMGTIKINRLQDYWKKDRLFNLLCFSDYMSRDRFLLILRCLHFVKNPTPNDLMTYFNSKMAEVYYPSKELLIDEAMVLSRGRIEYRQHLKMQRSECGLKLHVLTEPSGLTLRFAIFSGMLDDLGVNTRAANVVLSLLQGKLNSGHSVYMDSYYSTYHLATHLLLNKTFCTGTTRADCKHIPKDIIPMKLSKGETIARYSNGIMVGKWKDNTKDVYYISTEFQNVLANCENKRGDNNQKPLPIVKYNKFMVGTDRQDQMLAYYPCLNICIKWYKKIAIHIVQMLLLNSFHLYNKFSNKKMSFYAYRLEVIKELLPASLSNNVAKVKSIRHLPTKCKKTKPNGKTTRKRCRLCSEEGRRKDTIYNCESCCGAPGLCLEPCFKIYHKKLM